jgi:hypothetical protein
MKAFPAPFASFLLLGSLAIATSVGCASGNDDTSTSTTGSGSGGSGSGGRDAGSGGAGGATTSGSTSGSTSAGSTSSSGGGGDGGGGTGGGPVAGAHLLINEIGAEPTTAEFVEILNPGDEAVSLGDVYLSDNAGYWTVTSGTWDVEQTPGTDWIAQFPAGTSIGPGETIVIAGKQDFVTTFGTCPDYSWGAPITCGGDEAVMMEEPVAGGRPSIEPGTGHLSDNREMIVLFRWSGDAADPVEDIDYVTWGVEFDDASRADKTGEVGYAPDTARASQRPAPSGSQDVTISRCGPEAGETESGGNGSTGHDETSENLAQSFVLTTKTPGTANACP